MLTPQQIAKCHRLNKMLEQAEEIIFEMNELARDVGIPPLAIRHCGSKLIHGENSFSIAVNRKLQDHSIEVMQLMELQREAA